MTADLTMGNLCEDHSFPKNYICLNPDCSQKIIICAFCIKNNHQKCNEKLIGIHSDIDKFVTFDITNQWSDKELYSELDRYLDNQINFLHKSLLEKKKLLLLELRREDAYQEGDEFWSFIKKNSEFSYEKGSFDISIKSKLTRDEKTLEDFSRIFKYKIKDLFSRSLKEFNDIRFGKIEIMKIDDWVGDPSTLVKESDGKFTFISGANFKDCSDFFKYWKLPQTKIKLKVTIDSVRADNRDITFGIFSSKKLDQLIQTNQLKSCDFFCAFYGYGCRYMKGTSFGEEKIDPNGFEKGKKFFIEFTPGGRVKMYSENQKLELIAENQCDSDEQYYLSVNIWQSSHSCTIQVVL